MRKIFVGIDISKEKLNVCMMEEMRIIHEDELENNTGLCVAITAKRHLLSRFCPGGAP